MTESPQSNRPVVLVTGAARGQGLAIVERLIEKEFDVVAGDVLTDELASATAHLPSDRVLTQPLDVSSAEAWAAAVAATKERFGRLDGLVNNAGILHRALLVDEDPADFERAWRVNTLGPFLGMQATLPLLRESPSAAIVNTSSSAGMRPFFKHTGYTTSKWGTRGLSLTAAMELAEYGIRVNTVMPGPIATPMHDAANIERLAAAPLIGRAGTAQEIANTVVFLLSENASFTVGAEILVDGGHLLRMHT